MKHIAPTVISILMAASGAASAATTTITIGDMDCFGQNIVCPDVQIPAAFDNSTAGDPAKTDIFGEIGIASFSFFLDLTGLTVSNASVAAKVWGLDLFATAPSGGGTFGDEFEGARFQVNDVDVGTYFSLNSSDGAGPNRIETVMFNFDSSTLTTGENTVTITPEQDFLQFAAAGFSGEDAYAIDFVTVSFDTAVVPLPAGLSLLLGALGLLGLVRRRRAN